MSAEQSPRNDSVRAPSGNADYQWAQFDSEANFQHYYGEPHADDDRVIRCAVEAMKQAPPTGAELDVVDVGYWPKPDTALLCFTESSKSHGLGVRRE